MYLETFIAMLESSKADIGVEYTRKDNEDGTITIQLDIDRWVSH